MFTARISRRELLAAPTRLCEIRLVDGVGNSRVVQAPDCCIGGEWESPIGVRTMFRPLGSLTDSSRRPIWTIDETFARAAQGRQQLFRMRPMRLLHVPDPQSQAWWEELYRTPCGLPYLIYAALLPPDDDAVEGGRY